MKKVVWKLAKLAVVIGLPIYTIFLLGEYTGWITLIAAFIALVIAAIWFWSARGNKRRKDLMDKYGNESVVNDLMSQSFWQGQTAEQLLDSLGHPSDIDQKILKTKKKEVWKYNHQGGNRYGLRITLDDDLVVGWDQKD